MLFRSVAEQRVDGVAVRKCVLAGFSDHLAKRLDAGTLRCELVHNRRGLLARESAIQKSSLLVAAEISEVPCTTHPLGIRPAGEGGITPALGAVMNAVVDALSEYGVKHVEMPATPERVWRAIQEARMKAEG